MYQRTAVMSVLFVFFSSGLNWAADFEEGLRAFRSGDAQRALEQWQPLARSGHANAQHALGMMYEYGRGLERSDSTAVVWYRKAAEQGMPEAQYRLGVLHENGWGVAIDTELAAKWYKRAAELGHVFAQHDLAYMYLNGEGVPKDFIRAYKWLRIATARRPDLMTKHLRRVSKILTSTELKQAESLAQEWLNSQKI